MRLMLCQVLLLTRNRGLHYVVQQTLPANLQSIHSSGPIGLQWKTSEKFFLTFFLKKKWLRQAYKIDILKKTQEQKTHNSRKKLQDFDKIYREKKEIKIFLLQKYLLPEIHSIFVQKNSAAFYELKFSAMKFI